MKSKEAIESNRLVKNTQSKTGVLGESCEKAVHNEVHLNLPMRDNPSSDLENELPPHTDSNRFPFSNFAANNDGTYDYEETMHRPQESSTIQPDCGKENRELQEKSLPKPTVSALITASTMIAADTEADQQQAIESTQTPLNSAFSSRCGTSTQLRVFGKPL